MSDQHETPDAGASWGGARRVFWWWSAGWTGVVAVIVAVVLADSRRAQFAVARVRAEEIFRTDLLIHSTDGSLGGVYAPVSDRLVPDPLLQQVPGRDLTTADGRKLTLVSPTHRAKLTPEATYQGQRLHGRLIGLKPLRAENVADDWEVEALKRLTLTERTVAEVEQISGRPVFRYLAGVVLQSQCLTCHGAQGVRLGDVIGGISVTVPLDLSPGVVFRPAAAAGIGLTACWIVGLLWMRRSTSALHRLLIDGQRANQRLRASERRFQTLAEQAPVGIFETDAAGRCTYVNRRWCTMTGLAPAAARGADWTQALHPEDRAALATDHPLLVRADEEWRRGFRCLQPGGTVVWMQGAVVALTDSEGRITGYLGVSTDLTERRQAEEAIRESEARFRLVFEEGPLGLVLMDAEGRFIQVNRAFAEMLGSNPSDLSGKDILSLTHPESVAECRELLRQSESAPQTPFRLEQRYLGRTGDVVWGNLTAVFLRHEDGRPLMRLAMIQDTTARRLDESRLREQAALLDIAQDAICVQSLAGRIEFWNPAAEKLYGWTREEVLGAPGQDLLFGRVSRELLQAQADVLAKGSWSGELLQAGRGGRIIQAQSRFSLVRDSQGRPKSILIVSTDLTERKKLEQQFLRSQRMECIGALASGVAHDLNNVFSPILMVAECLADRLQESGDAELIELVRSSAERGAGVVRQLLAFSRGQEIDRVELRVDHLLKEMSRLARETFPRNITFSTYVAPDLWAVVGDVVQLHQVLLNLCVNARDAMPGGGRISIAASNFRADAIFCQMTPDAQPRPYVMLEITDNGEGIPESILDRVFDPFFTTKAPGKGTGLGLPTVLNIVKAHKGFLEVHSRVGEGTRFRVFLPAAANVEAEIQIPQRSRPANANGEHVLVLDDEEAVRESVRKVLQLHQYEPTVPATGPDAIRQFAQDPSAFHIIVTDMMMPEMEGPAFIRAVRKLSSRVPIIVMSGSLDGREEAQLAAEGNVTFLEKPFTGDALLRALHAGLHPDVPYPEA